MDRCEFYIWMEGEAIYSLVTRREMGIVTCCQVSRSVLIDELSV